jgi:pSer/pThr/pTyr-binding forkhead associated (FHA) protein
MKVKLISVSPAAPRLKIVVKRLPALVGRSPEADVCLSDPWVSRVHGELDQVDGTLVVRDIGSRHGTFVNGEQITVAELLPGDELSIGATSFEVLYRHKEKKPPAARQCETASPC